jgi:glycosyltransferase involved in cell wall biosynthesis
MSKVSILLPVYNSITRNGSGYIQQALNSLLNQTYKNFDLHILDNISTDSTADVCQGFAYRDSRIKFRIDTKQRFPEGGINKLAENINTKYLMIANCDDLWHTQYIEYLVNILEKNQDTSLAYPNGTYIDEHNNLGVQLIREIKFDYQFDWRQNFCLAIQFRSVVPMLFGLFRTEAYLKTLPYKPFDELKANVDNLFLAKFFLNGYKAKICDKQIFHYRDRSRELEPKKINGMPTNPILIWVYYIKHQLNLYKAVEQYIPKDNLVLQINALDSCMRYIIRLLEWVGNDFKLNAFENSIIEELKNRCKEIDKILLTTSNPIVTLKIYNNSEKKCALLIAIIQYIEELVEQNDMTKETIKLISTIEKGIKRVAKQELYNHQ